VNFNLFQKEIDFQKYKNKFNEKSKEIKELAEEF